jgi:hypothetical protein
MGKHGLEQRAIFLKAELIAGPYRARINAQKL